MEHSSTKQLHKYLSPLGVWALSFGCSVGWGAFVMPGTTFLPTGGPMGTFIGILIGALIMIIIGINYHYFTHRYSDDGGAITYVKKSLGADLGFLSAWFLALTYIAILWANATALSLFVKAIFGTTFRFGYLYTIANYDIYFGELIFPILFIILIGLLSIFNKKIAGYFQIGFAILLVLGVITMFFITAFSNDFSNVVSPAFNPTGDNFKKIISIIALAPWAFVGFESVSHSTGEFKFSLKKTLPILILAIVLSALCYILLSFVAVTTHPDGYSSWFEYISDLANVDEVASIPTFYAAQQAIGTAGIVIMGITVLSAIVTGIIGNFVSGSRVLYTVAKDRLLPNWFSEVNKHNSPQNSIIFIIIVSLFIPFLGRVALGWIVDITTIGISIVYGLVSISVFLSALKEKKKRGIIFGILGTVFSIMFMLYLLIPILSGDVLASESYLILVVWCTLGIIAFRIILSKDQNKEYGRSTIVWIGMFFLIFVTSLIYTRQLASQYADSITDEINVFYETEIAKSGSLTEDIINRANAFADELNANMNQRLALMNFVQAVIVIFSLIMMFNIFRIVQKRQNELEVQKAIIEEQSHAKSTFLSNMSHDIRTPMNAIVGYSHLALKEADIPENIKDYLNKIDTSSEHLLSIINDILDMSKIESGKMELEVDRHNIVDVINSTKDMYALAIQHKNLDFTIDIKVQHEWVYFDKKRFNRILLNLVSNAVKYTEEGYVKILLEELDVVDGIVDYELRIKDTGVGMSKEFATKVFDAFEREQDENITRIQGTGLGMSIVKSFIDLMDGSIDVKTEKGKGTEFIINLSFKEANPIEENEKKEIYNFKGLKALLVDDNEINSDIATLILQNDGFVVTPAYNGHEAVEIIKNSKAGDYDVIFMDIMMPIMNGYEATNTIRSLENKDLANIPIIAMTANAYANDIKSALDAGMNGHISKPLEIDKMRITIKEVLKK